MSHLNSVYLRRLLKFVTCCVRHTSPSEADFEFLQIASKLETYGLDGQLVSVSFCDFLNRYKYLTAIITDTSTDHVLSCAVSGAVRIGPLRFLVIKGVPNWGEVYFVS